MSSINLCLKNGKQSDLLPYFSSCRSTSHFVNVDFICRGEDRVSAHMFYLTSFSQFLSEIFLPQQNEAKVTVMLPEFSASTVQQLMAFVYTGRVDLPNRKSSLEFDKLAKQLGISTDPVRVQPLSLEATEEEEESNATVQEIDLISDDDEDERSGLKKLMESGDLEEDEEVKKKNERKRQSVESSFNEEPAGKVIKIESTWNFEDNESVSNGSPSPGPFVSKQIVKKTTPMTKKNMNQSIKRNPPCFLCGKQLSSLSHLLIHLSNTHYSDQIDDLFEANNGKCPVPECSKKFKSTYESKKNFGSHVGSSHKKVLDFLPKEMRATLQALLDRNGKVPMPPCGLCGGKTKGIYDFLNHLTSKHYPQKFKSLFETHRGACPFCPKSWTGNAGCSNFSSHVGATHKMVLNYVPDDIKAPLKPFLDEDEIEQLENVPPRRMSTPIDMTARKVEKKPSGLPPCRICEKPMDSKGEILSHLVSAHYYKELVHFYDAGQGQCPECPKKWEMGRNRRSRFAQHLGKSHKKVLDLLPRDMQNELRPLYPEQEKKADDTVSKNASVKNLLKGLASLKDCLNDEDESMASDPLGDPQTEEEPCVPKLESPNTDDETANTPADDPPLTCIDCHEEFPTVYTLKTHILKQHYDEQLEKMYEETSGICPDCPEDSASLFEDKDEYKEHLMEEHDVLLKYVPKEYADQFLK